MTVARRLKGLAIVMFCGTPCIIIIGSSVKYPCIRNIGIPNTHGIGIIGISNKHGIGIIGISNKHGIGILGISNKHGIGIIWIPNNHGIRTMVSK